MNLIGKFIDTIYNFGTTRQAIIQKHMFLVASGFVVGVAFAFLLIDVIGKYFHIIKKVSKSHAISIAIGENGEKQYCIKKPFLISDIIISMIGILYLKITGKQVYVASNAVKWVIHILDVLFLILIIYSIWYSTINIYNFNGIINK